MIAGRHIFAAVRIFLKTHCFTIAWRRFALESNFLTAGCVCAPIAHTYGKPIMPLTQALGILYVEDDASMATLVQKRLRRTGYEIRCAETGSDALAMWDSSAPSTCFSWITDFLT